MARILVVNFDDTTTHELMRLLRLRGYDAEAGPNEQANASEQKALDPYDLVVFDASRRFHAIEDAITTVHGGSSWSRKPILLGVMDVYHGPQWEFDLRKKGVQVVYVAPDANRL